MRFAAAVLLTALSYGAPARAEVSFGPAVTAAAAPATAPVQDAPAAPLPVTGAVSPATTSTILDVPAAPVTGAAEAPRFSFVDPARSQLFTAPTAYTLDEGASRVSLTELLVFQYNYGVTDDLQFGINTVYLVLTSVDLKWRFYAGENFSAAVLGGVAFMPFNIDFLSGYGRLAGTWSYDRLDVNLVVSDVYSADSGTVDNLVAVSGGLGWRAGERTRFLVEYDTFRFTTGGEPVNVIFWGARFLWPNFSVTPGYLTPLEGESLREGLVGIPYLDISYSF